MKITKLQAVPVTPPAAYSLELTEQEALFLTIVSGKVSRSANGGWAAKSFFEELYNRLRVLEVPYNILEHPSVATGEIRFQDSKF